MNKVAIFFTVFFSLFISYEKAFCDNVPDSQTPENKTTEIVIEFEKDLPSVVREESISGINDLKMYTFNVQKGKNLLVTIRTEDPQANIRIKAIISPSGKSEEYNGKNLERKIKEPGQWKVIIDEDSSKDEYTGKYILAIALR